MPLVLKDRVRETTTTTGTGAVTLAGAVPGFQAFSEVGNDNTCFYTITSDTDWEVGLGTYTASGNTLSRDTVFDSTNSGSLVSFGAGSKEVFITYPADRAVTTTDPQTLTDKTVEKLILNDGYTEEVFTITDGTTVNLDPNNGSIQTWTLGANRTPGQANWAAGQSITLLIDDGTNHTITWTTLAVVWKTDGGTAPTLETTGFTVIVLWKVGTTIYGSRVGDA
jgi:hypothetical protein